MSSPTTSPLSAGVQQLYNDGLLPSSLNASTLNGTSAGELNSIASSSLALQQAGEILGFGSSARDTASLSSTATNALLQEINPSPTSSTSASTDPLTAAVDNALTSTINAAVNQFAPPIPTTTGTQISVLG
jgi:hypothetical protein